MRRLELGILGFSILHLFITGYCIGKSLCIGPVGLSLEQVIKAVKDYTLKDKDGAKKLKPILQSLGVERLSLLPNDKLPEFVEGIRKVGVEI